MMPYCKVSSYYVRVMFLDKKNGIEVKNLNPTIYSRTQSKIY